MARKPDWINPNTLTKTGWPPGLLQDDSIQLSQWLSNRGNAKQLVDEKVAEIIKSRKPNETYQYPPSSIRQRSYE